MESIISIENLMKRFSGLTAVKCFECGRVLGLVMEANVGGKLFLVFVS